MKRRLPPDLSYPLGRAEVAAALADAPDGGAFHVVFRDHLGRSASDFRKMLRDGLPYHVAVADYRPAWGPGYTSARHRVDNASWWFRIYPVLRTRRHDAHRLLIEEGLPTVARWLARPRPAGWDSRAHGVELTFDPAGPSLSAREVDGA